MEASCSFGDAHRGQLAAPPMAATYASYIMRKIVIISACGLLAINVAALLLLVGD